MKLCEPKKHENRAVAAALLNSENHLQNLIGRTVLLFLFQQHDDVGGVTLAVLVKVGLNPYGIIKGNLSHDNIHEQLQIGVIHKIIFVHVASLHLDDLIEVAPGGLRIIR